MVRGSRERALQRGDKTVTNSMWQGEGRKWDVLHDVRNLGQEGEIGEKKGGVGEREGGKREERRSKGRGNF